MSKPIAYGIDFGTSNSSIAAAFPDHVELVAVEPALSSLKECLPSILYIGHTGNQLAGSSAIGRFLVEGGRRTSCSSCDLVTWEAGRGYSRCQWFSRGGGCADARIISGIKGDLYRSDRVITHSWARDFTLEGLAAIILHRLKQDTDRQTGTDVRRAVVGYPVAFVGTEGPEYEVRQRRAEERLVEAARLAGFEDVALCPEPAAAAMVEPITSGLALTLDFGGGTFDAAVTRYDGDSAEVISLKGTAVGGQIFDQLLFEAKVAPELGLRETFGTGNDKHLPFWFRNGLANLNGVSRLLGDSGTYPVLAEYAARRGGEGLRRVQELLYGGYAYAFYRAVEEAKIRLSSHEATRIQFSRARMSVDIPVTRAEYEELIRSRIEHVAGVIFDTLDAAAVTPDAIDVVLRTGGSSQTPLFEGFLERLFGVQKVHKRDAFTTVVKGLGMYARANWAATA